MYLLIITVILSEKNKYYLVYIQSNIMGRLTRIQLLQHNKPLIVKALKNTNKSVFSISELSNILNENKNSWRLAQITTKTDFINFLTENKILEEVFIDLPTRSTKKYVFKDANNYEIALSIRQDSYLSHYTALFIHGLTNNIIKNIYTNLEQTIKPSRTGKQNTLLQENIDRAFSRPMRMTNNIAKLPTFDVYLLNGKNFNRLEVIDYLINNKSFPVTSMERTLIDIIIRPNYSGDVGETLDAYKLAKGKLSVNRLLATLKKMNNIYPYHQAVGFYLERAGYDEKLLKLVEKIGINYNFYLTYQIRDKDFSKRWNIFYPKDL